MASSEVKEAGRRLLVVIPARNEEERLPAVIRKVKEVVPWAGILVVEDSSTDNTVQAARDAGALVVSLPVNIGYGGALQTGFQYASLNGYDTVVTLDGDGQHNPADIPALLNAMESQGADLVIGSRLVVDTAYRAGAVRRSLMAFFSVLTSRLSGQRIRDTTSGFQLISKTALLHFARNYPHDYPNAEVLVDLARRGGKIVEVPVNVAARTGGVSMFDFWSSLYYVLKMTLSVLMVLVRGRRRSR
jgi:hypothetical protein